MDVSQLGGYDIRDVLGEGGMGKVYLAHDPTLDRPVALKVILSKTVSPEAKSRFLREARACSRITHPNIITVYSAGEDNDIPYMAMELIDGRTLREIIDEGPMDWRIATRWMVDLLGALERLHSENIIHRDLKPENVMVTGDDIPKLMDFGLAHLENTTALTQEGTTLGTVPYMSPEQVLGKAADARSDLFSMATILHEMLTGLHPFRGEHPMAVMYSIQHDTPKPIKLQSQDYPPGLQDALDNAFTKEVDKRYQTAAEFRDALVSVLPEGTIITEGPSRTKMIIAGVAVAAVVAGGFFTWQAVTGGRSEAKARQHNEIGQGYLDARDWPAAETEFRKAIVADDRYAKAFHNLGFVMLQAGDTTEAVTRLQSASELDSTLGDPLFMLGTIDEARGDAVAAEGHYKGSILADPNFFPGYNNYAAVLMDDLRWQEARGVLDLAIARSEEFEASPAVLVRIFDKRAVVAEALGDTEGAARFAQQALELGQ